MATMLIVSKVFFFGVFVFCMVAMAVTFVFRKKKGSKDRISLPTVLLAGSFGVLVSFVYFLGNRTMSGIYVLHLTFAISPFFIQFVSDGGRRGIAIFLIIYVAVLSLVLTPFFIYVPWDVDGWLPSLMVVALLVQIGGVIRKFALRCGKSEPVSAGGEWMRSLVDILYYSIIVLLAFIGYSIGGEASWLIMVEAFVCLSVLVGLSIIMWLRLRIGRPLLFSLPKGEGAYVGKRVLKVKYIGNMELGLSGEELFRSLKEYFDERMPYLDSELTLTDVAKALVTNKVYLSRAINDFTGQNFHQFVNLYRVKYAIKLFNCNNAYKVSDLAVKSGFNCERSFIMAFRLYMNISPSRWCKQNRGKGDTNVLRK